MVHGLLLCTIIYFGLFLNLDSLSIRDWDESRNALNAIDMSWTHNYLVRSCFGAPDMWETKPPLLIWLQTASIKVFGYNELALRVPTASAAALMLLCMAFYIKHKFKSVFMSYAYVLIMLTTVGFLYWHNARSGDHEALLILFETIMVIAFYEYLQQNKLKYLVATFVCFVLAAYTKSTAALFFLPGMFAAIFIFGQWKKVFLDYRFWVGCGVSVATILAYYFLREKYNPGYIKAVLHNEVFRYGNTDTGEFNKADFLYYFELMRSTQFYWIMFLPISIVIIYLKKEKDSALMKYVLLLCVILYFILYKGSANPWYDAPMLPLLALVVAFGFNKVYLWLNEYLKDGRMKAIFPALLLVAVFYLPFYATVEKNMNEPNDDPILNLQYGYHFNQLKKENSPYKKICVLQQSYGGGHIDFYKTIFNKYYGYKISWKDMIEYRDCDTVMTSDKDIKWILNTKFNAKSVSTCKNSEIFILQPQK